MAKSWKKQSGLVWVGLGAHTECGKYYIQSEYVRGEPARIYYAQGSGERKGWASNTCDSKRSAQVQAEKHEAELKARDVSGEVKG